MKVKLLLVTFFVVVLNLGNSYGQIAAWDFNGESSPATSAADVFNAGLDSPTTMTRGAGAASSAATNSFRTTGFQNNGISTANTDYFQITLSAATGSTLSLSTIDARFAGTAGFCVSPGVSTQFAYSLDGTTFTLIGSSQALIGTPVLLTQIDLTGISALQNVGAATTITIRYYASGQSTTGGWGFASATTAGTYGLAIGGTITTGITTRQNGDWYDPNTWTGLAVPTSAQSAIVNHVVTNTTTSPANIVRNTGTTTTINSGGSLAPGAFTYTGAGTTTVAAGGTLILSNTYTNSGTTTVAGTVRIDQGASVATNAFSYTGTANTLILNGSSGLFAVSTPVNFWPTSNAPYNVTVQGTGAQINNPVGTVAGTLTVNTQLNCSVANGLTVSGTALVNTQLNVAVANGLLINGILQLNSGGFINTNSPVYGTSSTLRYNTTYSRNLEWTQDVTATIGTTPGYPNNVHVTNNSTLTYYNASNNGPKGMNGNLTIDALSTFTFTGTSTAGALTVKGNVTNAGTLSLGTAAIGDDIKTAGNFSNTGTFLGNDRAIWFIKAGTQTVFSSSTPFTIPYVVTDNGATVQLLVSVTISAPLAGFAIDFKTFSDIIDLNGFNLIVGTVGTNNTINGLGSFKGNTNSDLTLNGGAGSVGTLRMVTDYNLRNFTLNRQSATVGCVLGSAVTVSTALVLTNGILDLGNNPLTIGASGTIAGAPTNYIIADLASGVNPNAALRKVFMAGGSFTFPIGDLSTSANGSQYSPITVTFSGGSYGGYAGFAIEDLKEPNLLDAPTHYITRYWKMTSSGIAPTSYNISASYLAADIVGTESSSQSNQWNGTTWLNNGTTISGNTLTLTGATTLPTTNHFTAGRREQEINIKHVATNVPSGTTFTNFGTVSIGSTTTITFTVENLGQQSLLLGTATLSGANYSTNYTYTNGSPGSVAGFSSTTFTITLTNPTTSGLYAGSISIVNTDSNENPYVINFECTVVCPTINITSVTPLSGPEGTNVTINASGGDLSGTTVNFGGIAATIISSSSTQMVVTVPTGATGNINIVKTATSCVTTTPFTVSRTAGACSLFSDLIISEVFDSTAGSLGYFEVYNGTGSAINLTNYSIRRYADNAAFIAGTYTHYAFAPNITTIADGAVKYGRLSTDPNVATPDFDFTVTLGAAGINGDDILHLYNGSTLIDVYIVPTSLPGYVAKRNTTTLGPNPTSNPSDWTLTAPESTANLGTFSVVLSNPPTVNTDPVDVTTCNNTATFTASGTPVGAGAITYQWYYNSGTTTGWTAVATNSFTGVIVSGFAASSLTLTGAIGTYNGYQFYCSVIQNGACASISDAAQMYVNSTTWNGSAWSNSAPSLTVGAIITGNYNMAAPTSLPSFEACSLTINSPAVVTVDTGKFIAIQNDLTVNTGGSLTVENSGSLVMIDNNGVVTNNGTTQIKRTTSPFELYDYTYWSSPIDRPTLSTQFATWRTDYAFEFVTPNFYDALTINSAGAITATVADSFDDIAPWAWQGYTGQMANGKGYAIMGPTDLASYPNTTTVTFSGKVNNGIIMPKIYETANTDTGYVGVNNANDDYNLVGNPYPSAISADKFITTNGVKISGALYFWTHVADVSVSNPGPDVYNFISDDYAVYTLAGGTGTRASLTGSSIPSGFIASGQGFFVEAQANNVDLVFNNDMRIKTPNVGVYHNNSNFYRTSVNGAEKDRIWLNLQNADGMFGQLLVAYFDETTLDHDWAYDGRVNKINNYVSFYSLAPNEKYKIQARPAFEESDIVPLGYFSAVSGEFNISIDQKEGILNAEATNIYIEDLDLNIIHDLKAAPYTFTTNSGRFENRFLLRYTDSALNNPDFETLSNSVVVASNNGQMTIKSYLQTLEEVTVYDVLGRLLFSQKGIGTHDFSTNNISMSQQSVIVKIKLESGTIVTKKVLIN